MRRATAIVESRVSASREQVFELIVPIDLTSIFVGMGPLPAVIGARDQTGQWDAAGQTRTVLLSDGTSASELLTEYRHPEYFAYTVSRFTGPFGWLVDRAEGEWWFSSSGAALTDIRWSYTFVSRSLLAAPVLWLITKVLWRSYMKKALGMACDQMTRDAAIK